jgi:hypothetical protein
MLENLYRISVHASLANDRPTRIVDNRGAKLCRVAGPIEALTKSDIVQPLKLLAELPGAPAAFRLSAEMPQSTSEVTAGLIFLPL